MQKLLLRLVTALPQLVQTLHTPKEVIMPTGSEELIAAASQGDTARVQRLLADDPTIVDARDCFGETALMRAAKSGSFWTVAALITSGANTRLRSNASKTALQLAVDTRRGQWLNC